jgi:hypothetical protein
MARLADGKTTEEIHGYLRGITYPVLKHDVVHAARRNGAPGDIVASLERIPVTEFRSEEELFAAYGTMA